MPRASGQKEKQCSICKEMEPTGNFYKRKLKLGYGLSSECKSCKKIVDNSRYTQEKECSLCKTIFKPSKTDRQNCSDCKDYALRLKIVFNSMFSKYNQPYTPSWCDKDEMKFIAKEKIRKEKEGVSLELDHIVPLKSPFVCGLNTPDNLRLIPKSLNRIKNNYYWPNMAEPSQAAYFLRMGRGSSNIGDWS